MIKLLPMEKLLAQKIQDTKPDIHETFLNIIFNKFPFGSWKLENMAFFYYFFFYYFPLSLSVLPCFLTQILTKDGLSLILYSFSSHPLIFFSLTKYFHEYLPLFVHKLNKDHGRLQLLVSVTLFLGICRK